MTLTTHGTEYFRDPEMVRMAMRGVKVHEVDGAKFDIYGAGAVLYFIMENTFPGHGGLSRFERPAPEALRWIVRRAMADYGQRYGSAREMLDDLRAVASAADPWSVTPAQLPSMSGASVELVDADGPRWTPRPRTQHRRRPFVARERRRRRRSSHDHVFESPTGMTGAYAAAGDTDRPRAREQVAAARRRTSARRASVARSPHRRISGALTVLVAFGIAFFLAFAYAFNVGGFDEKSNTMMQGTVDEIMANMMGAGGH